MVRDDPELQARAKMFLRRELRVFEWTNENAEFVLEYIMAILKTVDLKAANGAAEGMLADFLGKENAGVFCHEVHAFLRSPYTRLEDWDRAVQYERKLPERFDEDGLPIELENRKRRLGTGAEVPDARRRRM